MTKFGAPLFARASANSQLGAVLFLALGVFVACGNDTPERPNVGSAGASGKTSSPGKSGKSGKGGEGAEAGDEALAGEAGMVEPGAGGMAQTGGSGGSTSETGGNGGKGGTSGANSTGGNGGGMAGTGGKGSTCGNGMLDPGEACDDGNTKFGDSCSPTCTNVCESCESGVCATNSEFVSCDGEIGVGDTATTGPGTGTKKSVLCKTLLACLKRSGCAQYNSAGLLKQCYCGTASTSECAEPGKANGPCVEEIAAAGEDRTTAKLVLRQVSPQYAFGVAALTYLNCDGGLCANECVAGRQPTACQKCSAEVGYEPMAACYTNPKADPELSAPLCGAALECTHRTACALNGAGSCFGVVGSSGAVTSQGACFAELTAAAPGLTPREILSQLNNPVSGTIGAVATELAQELDSCADSCFPIASGGTGGAGSGGQGGSGSGGTSGAAAAANGGSGG